VKRTRSRSGRILRCGVEAGAVWGFCESNCCLYCKEGDPHVCLVPSFLHVAYCISSSPSRIVVSTRPHNLHYRISSSVLGAMVWIPTVQERKNHHLRVNSRLRVPIMALERSNRSVPIDIRKAHELRNRRLLLGSVRWRHRELVAGSSEKAQCGGGRKVWLQQEIEIEIKGAMRVRNACRNER